MRELTRTPESSTRMISASAGPSRRGEDGISAQALPYNKPSTGTPRFNNLRSFKMAGNLNSMSFSYRMIREGPRTLCYRILLARHTVQLNNKITGPLMEIGVSCQKQKLHNVEYFTKVGVLVLDRRRGHQQNRSQRQTQSGF